MDSGIFLQTETIHFICQGTVAEWQAIEKDDRWDTGILAYTITCTDGTIAKDGTVTMN